eukprot:276445_1
MSSSPLQNTTLTDSSSARGRKRKRSQVSSHKTDQSQSMSSKPEPIINSMNSINSSEPKQKKRRVNEVNSDDNNRYKAERVRWSITHSQTTFSEIASQPNDDEFDNIVDEEEAKQRMVLVEQMGGQRETGDHNDVVMERVHCKVWSLDSGNYVERGDGMLNLSEYYTSDKEMRARILCRRDSTFTTLINASILKEMEFVIMGSFIRFSAVSVVGKEEPENEENSETKNEDNDDANEAVHTKTDITTYLIRSADNSKLLDTINDIKMRL